MAAIELELGPVDRYHQVAVVGAGVIGVSWAACSWRTGCA